MMTKMTIDRAGHDCIRFNNINDDFTREEEARQRREEMLLQKQDYTKEETQVDEQEKVVGGAMDKATLGLGLKLDQIEEEEFADRSSLDSDGAGGRGVVGRQPGGGKQVIFRFFVADVSFICISPERQFKSIALQSHTLSYLC